MAFHDAFVVTAIVSVFAVGAAFLTSDKLAANTMKQSTKPVAHELPVDSEVALAAG